MKNKLVVFEGIDGVGKSTTARELLKALKSKGVPAVCFEDWEDKRGGFNSLKPFIKKETSIEASLFFYIASSVYKSQMIAELLKKQWVICDRYIYSTLSCHLARGVDPKIIPNTKNVPVLVPDFCFLLETEEKIRIKRIKSRPGSTREDLTPKIPKSFFYLMEKAFESYKPIIIDNSKMNLKETVDKVMKIIGF